MFNYSYLNDLGRMEIDHMGNWLVYGGVANNGSWR